MAIKLVTDSSCDLSRSFIEENNIEVLPLILNIDGETVEDDFGETIPYKEFYNRLRNGSHTSTAQINVYSFEEVFRKYIEKGYEIIYIGLASALSGTFNSAYIARKNLLEEYPDAKIYAVDSKSISLGMGLVVTKVNNFIKEGKSAIDIVQWVENNCTKVVHTMLFEDLEHLKRGGRISGLSSLVGGMLNIKIVLELNKEGKLEVRNKVKGKKKALKHIVNRIKESAVNPENEILYIAHGDEQESVETLKAMILEEVNFKDVITGYVGVTVGSHGGPGVIAVVFMAEER